MAMLLDSKYRYTLEAGSKKFRCPACNKKRFVRYVDQETGNYLPDDVGRCDRELSCGYHKTPRQVDGIDLSNALYSPPEPIQQPVPSYLPFKYVERSLSKYEANTLIKWMATLPGWDQQRAEAVARLYKVGTATKRKDNAGWPIFWMIDDSGRVRSGKLMKYGSDGRRSKDEYANDTIESILKRNGKLSDFESVKCFYGLHLLDHKPVAIVESEKTAIIASQYFPQFTWMASSQLRGITEYKMQALRGCKVVLFPDIGCYDQWFDKALEFAGIADITVSSFLEENAPDQHKGYDLADYLTQYDIRDFSPHGWNPYTGEIFDQRGYPASWDDV